MSEPTHEILLFQVGARVFAAEVYDVVRIGVPCDSAAELVIADSVLGKPLAQARALVIATHEDHLERLVAVDHVLGVRSVSDADLHPLPAFAAACLPSAAVTGFVMVDDAPILLVDLPTLVREQLAAHANAA